MVLILLLLVFILVGCGGKKKGGEEIESTITEYLKQNVEKEKYFVGEEGPAGGIVFYDKGNKDGGWRYLEVSPLDTEFEAAWGAVNHDVSGTSEGIGFGKQNTELIVAMLNQLGETGKAAQLCQALNINGFTDWFLPSKEELILLYERRYIIGGFSRTWYWSSMQCTADDAWFQDFNTGNAWGDFHKGFSIWVRAIRAF